MGKLFLKDKVTFLIIWALMASHSAAEMEFFYQTVGRTWNEARSHCQACFKDLVTLTPENIPTIVKKVSSESWVGLRKSFDTNSTVISNVTTHENNNSTSNSTFSMPWSRWANGDPLSFQNWYLGWPNSSRPKRDCCSCSCTCPTTSQPTTPGSTTQSGTTQRVTNATWSTNFTTQDAASFSWLGGNATESVTGVSGREAEDSTENTTNTATNISTQSIPMYTTTPPMTTSQPPIRAECVKTPMPDDDEKHIEESCVAMLSFGAWVEKECSTILHSICYEERFFGKASVSNVTSTSALLTWDEGPGNISHYRVEYSDRTETLESTNSTFNLENLTAGSNYSVKVFAVKCDRDLNPQEVEFYTRPNKVLNLTVANQTETSISLMWQKPDGERDFYETKVGDKELITETESEEVDGLVPGYFYTFTVRSGVKDRSRWSDESRIDAYTKPEKVSNLEASDNTNTSLLLRWEKPAVGNSTGFCVTAVAGEDNRSVFERLVKQTQVNVTSLPTGSRITLSVRAVVNGNVMGEEVTINSFTAPAPVTHLTLTSGHDNITASWKHPNGTGLSFKAELQLNGDTVTQNSTGLSVIFQGLKSGAKYTVTVYAVSGHQISPPETKSIFTLPMPPTDLKVIAFKKDTITVTWKEPVNGVKSDYEVKITSSFWGYSNKSQVNKTSFKFEGLRPGTSYTVRVWTVANQKRSSVVSLKQMTEPDVREISLSLMCSSLTPLLCEEKDSRESVLTRLKYEMKKQLGDLVFWKFEE